MVIQGAMFRFHDSFRNICKLLGALEIVCVFYVSEFLFPQTERVNKHANKFRELK